MKKLIVLCLVLAACSANAQTIDTLIVRPGQRILIIGAPAPTPAPDSLEETPDYVVVPDSSGVMPAPDSVVVPPVIVPDTLIVPPVDTIVTPPVPDPIPEPQPQPEPPKSIPVLEPVKEFKPRFIIDPGKTYYDGKSMGVQPGDTVGVLTGTYTSLILKNFMGAAGKPIVVINYKGKAIVRGTTQNNGNFSIQSCSFIKITGSGVPGLQYGFEVSSSYKDVSALVGSIKTTNIEIERVEVSKSGFAGIMLKTDPSKNDPTTWLGSFIMQDVHVHDCFVHDTQDEGLYIGNSFWNAGQNGLYPHEILGLHIHHNVIARTGCEGIQYSCSPGASVHHNTVVRTGISPFSNSQNAGVQISGGSSGEFYQNTIDSANGIGLIIVGALRKGDTLNVRNVKVTNSNIFAGAEKLPAETAGLFVDERAYPPGIQPGGVLHLINVTIDGARQDAVRLYNQTPMVTVFDRCVLQGWSRFAIDKQSAVDLRSTNVFSGTGTPPAGLGYQPE